MGCRGQVVEWDASSVPMPCWRCRERVTTLHTNRRHRAVRRRILGSDALANRHRTAGVTSSQVRVLAVPRQAQPPSAPRREPSLSWTTRERVGQRALSAGGRVGWPDAPRASRVREAPQFRFRSSAQGGQQLFRRRGPSRIPGEPLLGGIHKAVERPPSVVYAKTLFLGLWRSWRRKKRCSARPRVRGSGNM